MSELNVYHHELRPGEYAEFYLKYEADKAIARHKYKRCLAIARHKYKRCLAMYRYCAIKALYELDFKGNDVEWKWYSKWMHKWFNLAKIFKEAK